MDDNRIRNILHWCSESYSQHGRKFSLPANTDPAKTYQWRYASAMAKKFEEWELNDEAARKFIDIAVQTSKENGTICKGLAVLHQSNMLSICYNKLLSESTKNNQLLRSLICMKRWVRDQVKDNDPIATLLYREQFDGFCNLTLWYKATQLSELYLALSASCSKSLARLNLARPQERNLLPSAAELYIIRGRFLNDSGNARKAKEIFGTDWRKLCLSES